MRTKNTEKVEGKFVKEIELEGVINMPCPLCEMKHLTEWQYSDEKIVICYCKTHPKKHMVVLRRHVKNPIAEEIRYMVSTAKRILGFKAWRYPKSILEHFHLQEV